MGKRQVFQTDRAVPRAPGWGTLSHSVLPLSSSPSARAVPLRSCQEAPHGSRISLRRPTLHTKDIGKSRGANNSSAPSASAPPGLPSHPVLLTLRGWGSPGGAQPPFPTPPGYKQAEFPAEGMAAMRRRARHLPGANSWPGLCSSAPQTPSTGRIPAASSQAAGQE